MKSLHSVIALVSLLTLLPSMQGQGTARIEGRVVGGSGEALPRATLLLSGRDASNSVTANSDDNGRFRFENLTPGPYALVARKTGYLDQRYSTPEQLELRTPNALLDLKAGSALTDLVFKLTPQYAIGGRVTDSFGDPVPKIQILALQQAFENGRRHLRTVGSAQTDDQGDYRISNLEAGRYYVQASDPSLLGVTVNGGEYEQPTDAIAPTYYPSADSPANADVVEVLPASPSTGLDIRLRRSPVYSVKGRVSTDDGASIAGQRLVMAPKGSDQTSFRIVRNYSVAQVQPDGSVAFHNLRPGVFEIAFTGNSQAAYTSRAEVVIGASNVEGLSIPLARNGPVGGVVTVEGGDAQKIKNDGLVVRLAQMGGIPLNTLDARVRQDGTFQVQGAGPVPYRWSVGGLTPEYYVKSVSFNADDVTRTPIDNASGRGGRLEIVLAPGAGALRGTARGGDNKEIAGAVVYLWPKIVDLGSTGGGVRTAVANQDGGFEFAGLTPGEYYVGAWETLDAGLAESGFLSRFIADVTPVTIAERARATVDVSLVPAGRVADEIAKLPWWVP